MMSHQLGRACRVHAMCAGVVCRQGWLQKHDRQSDGLIVPRRVECHRREAERRLFLITLSYEFISKGKH
jgi:hypothetical protein